MKKYLILLSMCICTTLTFSQDFSYKYGKVTTDELKMSVYDKDTTASAVVIYEDAYFSYTFGPEWFQTVLDVKQKIKILTQDGFDQGNISIPYYYNSNGVKDAVSMIEAVVYNLENGKIVKTKLDKKYMFDEEINSYTRQVKFSVPGIKVGTVIEYKYRLTSNHTYSIPDWNMQKDIPVILSTYKVVIPEYYYFNVDASRGMEKIVAEDTYENQTFNIRSGAQSFSVPSTSRALTFKAEHLPALKDESFVWCIDDFLSGVHFELRGTKFPGELYKPFTQTWESLEKVIMDSDFGRNLKMSSPYKNEIVLLSVGAADEKEKINRIYGYVKNNIRWDETYGFYGNKSREAAKTAIGNNAQINMILINTLRDAGIKAYPVLLSRRSNGRLPYMHPSINKINTFVVCAETSSGERFYMDGSAVYGGLNMLPVGLLVDRGRAIDNGAAGEWVNLTDIGKNQETCMLSLNLAEDGTLSGEKNTKYVDQLAYSYKNTYNRKKDSTEYIENIENKYNIEITGFEIAGKENISNAVTEKITFTKQIESSGDYIYINPMLFGHIESNPFTQSERKLPIEFNYPYGFIVSCMITIPENYEVDELPKSVNMQLEEKGGRFTYNIAQRDNTIQLNYRFNISQVIFPVTGYEAIREFYGLVAAKNMEQIVLKKIK